MVCRKTANAEVIAIAPAASVVPILLSNHVLGRPTADHALSSNQSSVIRDWIHFPSRDDERPAILPADKHWAQSVRRLPPLNVIERLNPLTRLTVKIQDDVAGYHSTL